MSTVAEIIEAVKRLPQQERAKFLQRLAEAESDDAWDRLIAADAAAGRLDRFIDEARHEHQAGGFG